MIWVWVALSFGFGVVAGAVLLAVVLTHPLDEFLRTQEYMRKYWGPENEEQESA